MINLVNWQQEEPTDCGGERQLSMDGTSRVSREAQARICERLGVRLPGATRPSLQGAYTWSKNLSNVSSIAASANSNNASDLWQQYGPTGFSRPHRFIANYTWDLPLRQRAGAMGKLAEGWAVS